MGADAESLRRSLSLHLGPEGTRRPELAGDVLAGAGVLRAPRVPGGLTRRVQRVRSKLDQSYWERRWLDPLVELRRRALGSAAAGPPRFLIRVDEFPDAISFYGPGEITDEARRFHEVMMDATVPYLIAVLPTPAVDPFNPVATGIQAMRQPELDLLERMGQDGVSFAQHGTTHRTRHRRSRRHSELVGLSPRETAELLDEGRRALAELGIEPRVFVPPFNRFAASQYAVLAQRYDIVCGGPESIAQVGFWGGPLWWADAVYLPCYEPLYGRSFEIAPAAQRLIERQPGIWVPIALHLTWETAQDFRGLRKLLGVIGPHAASWQEFLGAVDSSRRA